MAIFSDNFNDGTFDAWTDVTGTPVIRCCNGTDGTPAFSCSPASFAIKEFGADYAAGNINFQLASIGQPSGDDFAEICEATAEDIAAMDQRQSFYLGLNRLGTLRIGRNHLAFTPSYEWHVDSAPGAFAFDGLQHGVQVGFTYAIVTPTPPDPSYVTITATVAVDNVSVISITDHFCGWHDLLSDSLPDTWNGLWIANPFGDIGAVDDVSCESSSSLVSLTGGNARELNSTSCTTGSVYLRMEPLPAEAGAVLLWDGGTYDGSAPGPGGTLAGGSLPGYGDLNVFAGGDPPWQTPLAFDGVGLILTPPTTKTNWTAISFTISNGDDPDDIDMCPGDVVYATARQMFIAYTGGIAMTPGTGCVDKTITITGEGFYNPTVEIQTTNGVVLENTVLSNTATSIVISVPDYVPGRYCVTVTNHDD